MSVDLPIHACGMRLLLSGRELSILPDNHTGNEFFQVSLDDLQEVTSGSVLLKAWVSVYAREEEYEVSCDASETGDVKQFLCSLRERWLGAPSGAAGKKHPAYGMALDAKFTALLRAELDPGEEALAQYFDSSLGQSRRHWLRVTPSWTPSHLVAVTSAHRVLWITDHYSEHRERAASVSRSISLAGVSAIDVADVGADRTLRFRFGPAACWSIPIRLSNGTAVDGFVDAVIGCLS